MRKAETAASLAFLALGVFMGVDSMRLPYMLESVPGPGFLPRWIALGLVVSGLALAATALRPRAAPAEPVPWPDAVGWRRVGLVFGGLSVSLLVLGTLGFLVTTTLFMAVVIFGLGVRSWLMLATVPLLAASGLYLVFAVWLRVPLPQGVLPFFG